MGNQVKKMGKALMLVLAMLVCFNIGVMAQEIEATMAPENVKEACKLWDYQDNPQEAQKKAEELAAKSHLIWSAEK